ncbi:hypothetical protein CRI94_09135 [Longibacter salinarum]|uniref:Uncharacterized protein n=1 Tax=Longibacter salinarum TaxID=1850348 RepID=A0A2A8CXZ5_9BACT|nr:hypothetical protein [Longibacter salinarum]PEN13473.1 hypothetical protein CRI94_09135 [Longibacter salinarum]
MGLSLPAPDLAPIGILVLSGRDLLSLNTHARTLLTGSPDADLQTCRTAARPILDRSEDASASSWTIDITRGTSSRPTNGRLHVAIESAADEVRIAELRSISMLEESKDRRAREAFDRAVKPIYRAFAHDARNPLIASQLQTGILRELDADALAERAPTIAQTLDRHLSGASEGISILVDELAPDPDDPPTDVLNVIDYVRRLTLPYAQKKSATVQARTMAADLYTRAPVVPLRRMLIGFLARLLPHAASGNRIEIQAEKDVGDEGGGPIITLTAHGLMPTADVVQEAIEAVMYDAFRCEAQGKTIPTENGTCIRILLPAT